MGAPDPCRFATVVPSWLGTLEERSVFPATHSPFSPHAERAMRERFTRLRADVPLSEPPEATPLE